ncbi:MAG TPA: hypothetical protein VD971_03325 [Phycisphaerales bacterium]|nr:hypothetical protein [Phycisphaerales bacterium]
MKRLSIAAACSAGPPVAAACATLVVGPFHGGWIPLVWIASGLVGLAIGLFVARCAWDELGPAWAFAALVAVTAGWGSIVWVVGALDGWTK